MERYNVLKSIGSGATSEVFLVEDKRSRRSYIMKQMPSGGMSEQDRARAKQEINVLQKIDHPNVVRYRESFITHDSICIVMERCATSLDAIIDKKRDEVEQGTGQPFPTSLLLEWMAELISAVHCLHMHQIIHRDIKPSNIFITDTNHLKLGDFGVCKVIRQQTEARKSLAQHPHPTAAGTLSSYVIASHGAMLGTPLYLSPEIFEEEIPEYSAASDVWALGAVFYEMCALHPPFEADNFFALIHRISSGGPPAPFPSGVDYRFERIVSAMMQRDAKLRPSTQVLIDQYVMLPPTHPSHPSQRPEYGRYIQRFHGLVMDVSTSTSGGDATSTNTSALEASTKTATVPPSSQGPVDTPPRASPTGVASASPGDDTSSDDSDGPPRGASEVSTRSPVTKPASPAGAPAATSKPTGRGVVSPKEKVGVPKKATQPRKQPSSAAAPSHNSSFLGPEDHEEALRRIRGAKSKIDVVAIRKHMLQRRADALDASARSDASFTAGDIPTSVLCPVASRERSVQQAEDAQATSPHTGRRASPSGTSPSSQLKLPAHVDPFSPDAHQSCGSSGASPPVPSRIPDQARSLCASVQSLLEAHGDAVSLEDLDEVAMLLNQYKLRRFGVY